MTKTIFQHNEKTLNEVIEYIRHNQDCCVVNDCGTGKSQIMSELIKRYPDKTFLVITQQRNAAVYFKGLSDAFSQKNVCIITYSKMVSDFKSSNTKKYNADFYLVDEAHYVGAKKRSEAFTSLTRIYKPRLIGFTATPQRFKDQGTDKTIVTTFFSGNSAGNVTAKSLVKKGIMIEPDYYLSVWDMANSIHKKIQQILDADEEDIDVDHKEQYITKLYSILEKLSDPKDDLRKILPLYINRDHSNRILIYASNIEDILTKKEIISGYLREFFPHKDIKEYVYTYRTSENELHAFEADDDTYLKVLYSVNKIMETIHPRGLNVVMMMRPSVSYRIITQQFGRINSLQNKDKIAIIDMVDNLSNLHPVSMSSNFSQKKKIEKPPAFNVKFASPLLSQTISLFDIIDGLCARSKPYVYQDFTGSLRELCFVYCKDYNDMVQQLKTYIYIDEAIRHTKSSSVNLRKIDSDVVELDFELTNEMCLTAEQNINLAERFIERHNIEDDDLRQIVYCKYLQGVYFSFHRTAAFSVVVHTCMKRGYLAYLRKKHIKENVFCDSDIYDLELQNNMDIFDEFFEQEKKDAIHQSIQGLYKICEEREINPKGIDMLCKYIGFYNGICRTYRDIGRDYHVTGNTVSQHVRKTLWRFARYFGKTLKIYY